MQKEINMIQLFSLNVLLAMEKFSHMKTLRLKDLSILFFKHSLLISNKHYQNGNLSLSHVNTAYFQTNLMHKRLLRSHLLIAMSVNFLLICGCVCPVVIQGVVEKIGMELVEMVMQFSISKLINILQFANLVPLLLKDLHVRIYQYELFLAIYCYSCNDDKNDDNLAQHLNNLGIDVKS